MIIGIIGCGGISRAHIRALSHIQSVKKLALFDINEQQMRDASEEALIPVMLCSTIDELALNCHGAIICNPNNLHVQSVEELLKVKSIPIVCEKPLSNDFASAEKLVDMVDDRSIVSFNYRYNKVIKEINENRATHDLGKLNYFRAEFNKKSAVTRTHLTWRDSGVNKGSSGALGDLSCHLLDLFCFLSSDEICIDTVKVVKGTRVRNKDGGRVEVDDNGYVFGQSNGGVNFKIKSSKSEDDNNLGLHLKLIYEKGEISYSTRQEDCLKLSLFDVLGTKEINFDNKKLIADPKNELPFWSDSFYYMLSDWCMSLKGEESSRNLPIIRHGLKIQNILEKF